MTPAPDFRTQSVAERIRVLLMAAEFAGKEALADTLRPIYLDVLQMEQLLDERTEDAAEEERMRFATEHAAREATKRREIERALTMAWQQPLIDASPNVVPMNGRVERMRMVGRQFNGGTNNV